MKRHPAGLMTLATLAALGGSGCYASLRPFKQAAFGDAQAHAIFVDGDGRPLRPSTDRVATTLSKSPRDDSIYGDWIHGILMGLRSSGRREILLRIHGGLTPLNLVTGDTGLTRRIMDQSPYYPIYINWESSIQGSYLDHLLYIRGGRAYRGWDIRGPWVSPFYFAADAGRAITRAPVTWTAQAWKFVGDLHSQNGIVSAPAKRAQSALFPDSAVLRHRCDASTTPLFAAGPPIIEYGSDCRSRWERALSTAIDVATTVGVMPYDRNAGRFGHNTVGRFSLKLPSHLFWPRVKLFSPWAVRHIAWIPIRPISSVLIDMAGQPAYVDMRRRTHAMVHLSSEIVPTENAKPLAYRPASGALAQLMDSLQALAATTAVDTTLPSQCAWSAVGPSVKRASGDPYHVSVVAISLGAAVAAEIVQGCPGIPFRNIVFMGAAASERDFEQGILPYLRADTAARFFNLTLNPSADRNESPAGLFFSTSGSMLDWLDGVIYSPESDGDRVIGTYENAISTLRVLPDSVRGRVFIKSFGYRSAFGNGGMPYRHADFGLQPYWKCTLWAPSRSLDACTPR